MGLAVVGEDGFLDLAAEISEIDKTEGSRHSYGRYFSAAAYIGPVSILGEYKDYYNFAYRYNQPPNAGRADEAYEHNDVKGPRLLVSADIFSTGTLLHASYGSFNTHKKSTSPGGTNGDGQNEWYAGIEQTIGRIYFTGSYFDRDWVDRVIGEKHTLADLHVRIGRAGEVILGIDQRLEESNYFSLDTTRNFSRLLPVPLGHRLAALLLGRTQRLRPGGFLGRRDPIPPKPSHRHRVRRRRPGRTRLRRRPVPAGAAFRGFQSQFHVAVLMPSHATLHFDSKTRLGSRG